MKRQPTEEQKAKAEERRAKLRNLWQQIGAMSEEERKAFAENLPTVVTCEGHPLTLNNTMLLALQAQNVTVVGGFRQWIAAGRCVRKGESALGIWIPTNKEKGEQPNTDHGAWKENKEQPDKPINFFFGSVFDISQTEPIGKGT